MSEIIIETEGAAEPVRDADHSFAAGEVVGEFRSHMESCAARDAAHDAEIAALRSQVSELQAAHAAVAAVAVEAAIGAAEAEATADVAIAEAASEPEGDGVVEMTMPEVPSEEPAAVEQKRGFHLWG
jgi:hypothetical protein